VAIPHTPILLLRFPDGDVEHRSTRGELPVGTIVRSRGTLWRITRFENDAAILEAAAVDGAPGGPVVSPDPLGDTPLTLEIFSEE